MMPAQMAGGGTPRKHGQMLKLAKEFFAEQHAFLNQVVTSMGRSPSTIARRG